MKKHTLLTYLLIVCIAANILPPPPAPQPDPDEIIEPLSDLWEINKN